MYGISDGVKVGSWIKIESESDNFHPTPQPWYHVPFAVQCIYRWSEGGEDGDGKEGSKLHGGWEKVEIA